MSRPRFRVGRHRPTNIYVQLGPEPGDVDPQIGYINEGWAKALVGQANEVKEIHDYLMTTTPVTLPWPTHLLTDYRDLYGAAVRLLRWYDDNMEVEDVTDEMAGCLADLRGAMDHDRDTEPG